MRIGPQLFREAADRESAKQLFVENVTRVEIETHSYCNRRCTYCPNVIGDRIGPNERMAEDLWARIMDDLEEISFGGKVVLNYYNEPMADRAILDRIREVRRRLPNSYIMIYSNGDYLDPVYVDELAEAGLNYLHISIHLKRGDKYGDVYVVNRMIEIAVRMGIPAKIHALKSNQYAIARAAHPTMEIEIRGINFEQAGTNRGGLIDEISNMSGRTASCFFPFVYFTVGYDGVVVPCCHIRGDRPEHRDYTYGNLRDYGSIFEAYAGKIAVGWRREVGGGGYVKRAPCDTCSAGIMPNEQDRAKFESLNARFSGRAAEPSPAESGAD